MHSVEQSIIKDTRSSCDWMGGGGGYWPPGSPNLQEPYSELQRGGCGSSSQFSLQKTSRHSSGGGGSSGGAGGGGGGAGGGSSSFIAGRRSRSASPSTQQEKHPSHHERGQKKVSVFSPCPSCPRSQTPASCTKPPQVSQRRWCLPPCFLRPLRTEGVLRK